MKKPQLPKIIERQKERPHPEQQRFAFLAAAGGSVLIALLMAPVFLSNFKGPVIAIAGEEVEPEDPDTGLEMFQSGLASIAGGVADLANVVRSRATDAGSYQYSKSSPEDSPFIQEGDPYGPEVVLESVVDTRVSPLRPAAEFGEGDNFSAAGGDL